MEPKPNKSRHPIPDRALFRIAVMTTTDNLSSTFASRSGMGRFDVQSAE
jgi:hypothetical protein